ncbi:MAG: hypothetical protein HC767_02730 [Akkermansiaceae bacterium]|nr:hypothetical protein [Akkermansiaceae bacterium]
MTYWERPMADLAASSIAGADDTGSVAKKRETPSELGKFLTFSSRPIQLGAILPFLNFLAICICLYFPARRTFPTYHVRTQISR